MNSQVSQEQKQKYIHYLQAQVDKFSTFIITQKNLNERHMQFQKTLNHILKKIQNHQQKIALIEVYQNDNLFQCKKMNKQKQNIKLLEKRFDSLQNQLKIIYKKQYRSQKRLNSPFINQITNKSSLYNKNKSQNIQRRAICQQNDNKSQISENQGHTQDQINVQKSQKSVGINNSSLYELQRINQTEVYRYIEQIKQNLQIGIKKIQIETQKNKQTILKLSNHFNNLTSLNNINLQKFKRESRAIIPKATSENTKQITSPQLNSNSETITKKQIKNMEKRLHSIFNKKVQQISNQFRKNSLKQQQHKNAISLEKYKFKTLQDNFEKQIKTCQNTEPIKSYKNTQTIKGCQNTLGLFKQESTEKQVNSKRKKSLFNNDILKDKNLNNSDKKSKSKSKKKKNNKQEESFELKQLNQYKKKSKKYKHTSKQKQKEKQLKNNFRKIRQSQINDYMMY